MKILKLSCSLLFVCLANGVFGQTFDSSRAIEMKQDYGTVLLADISRMTGDLKTFPGQNGVKHLFVMNWKSPGDSFAWTIRNRRPGRYILYALIKGYDADVTIKIGKDSFQQHVNNDWDRLKVGELNLGTGLNEVTVFAPKPGNHLQFYSVELITPENEKIQLQKAARMRSSTAWMRAAKYGLQFHWTSKSQPVHGAAKKYSDAVKDFDTERFAKMVHETGAGYIILTTSHAEFYFPAPIKAIDAIMPGRTSERDLVADLARSLQKYNVKLMLYFHVGHDHYGQPGGWWEKFGFNSEKPEKYLNNWKNIMREVGNRYKDKLAGWFYDDGVAYYPLNPDFEQLAQAAKAGNKNRVICFNPWILPKLTEFQDYLCGEGYDFLKRTDHLPSDGSGIYQSGPQANLQAHTNFILEKDWGHFITDTTLRPPSIPLKDFLTDMKNGIAHGIVPSVNIEISQDGEISPESARYMKLLNEVIHQGKSIEEVTK